MELFRHYFTAEEWATSIFFTQHLNDFGFCNLDGSVINVAWNDTTGKIRYNLDNKGEVYLAQRYNSSYLCPPAIFPFLSGLYNPPKVDYDIQYIRYYNEYNLSGYVSLPVTVFFIPLINKGFFLHIRSNNTDGNQSPLSISNDERDKTFSLNTPTPSLNIKVYGTKSDGYNYLRSQGSGVLNFIGLPPSTGNPLHWTYLCYTGTGYFAGNTEDNNQYINYAIDYGNGRVTDMPFRSGYTRDYNNGNPISKNNLTYTNVNANVCSLIKMPFDTGYIDNIYLLATAPKLLEDGTFFSFNGRNFLNVFENYVLELPST